MNIESVGVIMAFIVEMVGGVGGNSWHFSCGGATWKRALQLARDFGWEPNGTSPDPIWHDQWDAYGNFLGDYRCDELRKIISADDAAAFADALERASKHPLPAFPKGPVLLLEGMTANQYRQANAGLFADFLAKFIGLLRNGEFSFFWDD